MKTEEINQIISMLNKISVDGSEAIAHSAAISHLIQYQSQSVDFVPKETINNVEIFLKRVAMKGVEVKNYLYILATLKSIPTVAPSQEIPKETEKMLDRNENEKEQNLSQSLFKDFYLNIKTGSQRVKMPERANPSDAGMDVFSPIDYVIPGRGDSKVSLGWICEFPPGFVMIFKEKSGRATKDKLDIGASVVDSGYRGEVHVHLFNNSDEDVIVNRGEKIAQFLIYPCWDGNTKQVREINTDTDRGAGGFGSTGK